MKRFINYGIWFTGVFFLFFAADASATAATADLTAATTGIASLASAAITTGQVVAGAIGVSFGVMGLMAMMKENDPEAHTKGIKQLVIGSVLIGLVYFMGMFGNTLGGTGASGNQLTTTQTIATS